jgi:hypothetical protein
VLSSSKSVMGKSIMSQYYHMVHGGYT